MPLPDFIPQGHMPLIVYPTARHASDIFHISTDQIIFDLVAADPDLSRGEDSGSSLLRHTNDIKKYSYCFLSCAGHNKLQFGECLKNDQLINFTDLQINVV